MDGHKNRHLRMERICRLVALLLCFSICFLVFSGCKEDGPQTLRVLIDESDYDDTLGIHSQLNKWVTQFEAEHEGVTVVLEVLPLDSNSRNPMIQQIRSELMSGNGPDVILMPNAYSDRASAGSGQNPLINDVRLAMKNGLFLDISKYYDEDIELAADELQQTVMDAGVLGEARYVLPLRYDIPIMYVDKQAFSETGLRQDIFESNVIELMDNVVALDDNRTAANFRMHWIQPQFTMNFLPSLIDYDTGKVAVSQAELEVFFQSYQNYWVRLLHAFSNSALSNRPVFYQYQSNGEYWTGTGNFMFIGSMQQAVENITIAKTKNIELEMYPVRSMDGSVIADVTYYGAISAGSQNPELAYEFLRAFLTEDFQWERNLIDVQGVWKLAGYGWPVRSEGSYAALTESIWARSEWKFSHGANKIPKEALLENECSILSTKIDKARFSIPLEHSFYRDLWTLYDKEKMMPSDVDIPQLAQKWLEKLQLHLDEG